MLATSKHLIKKNNTASQHSARVVRGFKIIEMK